MNINTKMEHNLEYYRNQVSLARTEIKNLRQQLQSLKHEHLKQIQLIKSSLNKFTCESCSDGSATSTITNGVQPQPSPDMVTFKPMGFIETGFQNKRGVPRQPSVMVSSQGAVVVDNHVFNNPGHALSGLEEFSHMWIIFHFHAVGSNSTPAKVSPPRLQGERTGVFATRSPHRPCPIGLSLVKILKIEGNKIYFHGVDMVNGTPVLDIKPYIPQYDYPSTFGDAMSSLVRPPTEGISDAAESLAPVALADESFDSNRLSPRLAHPLGVNASSPVGSPIEGEIPSPDNLLVTPVSPSPDSPTTTDFTRSPLRRPDTERGAPDGQERFTPPQSALLNAYDGIRVAPWIVNPPSQTFQVRFSDDALVRLDELIGERAQMFKSNIEGLLSEDPRSQYVRQRYPNHEYSCVLEDLSISCIFDDATSVCTIVTVRSAEELQN